MFLLFLFHFAFTDGYTRYTQVSNIKIPVVVDSGYRAFVFSSKKLDGLTINNKNIKGADDVFSVSGKNFTINVGQTTDIELYVMPESTCDENSFVVGGVDAALVYSDFINANTICGFSTLYGNDQMHFNVSAKFVTLSNNNTFKANTTASFFITKMQNKLMNLRNNGDNQTTSYVPVYTNDVLKPYYTLKDDERIALHHSFFVQYNLSNAERSSYIEFALSQYNSSSSNTNSYDCLNRVIPTCDEEKCASKNFAHSRLFICIDQSTFRILLYFVISLLCITALSIILISICVCFGCCACCLGCQCCECCPFYGCCTVCGICQPCRKCKRGTDERRKQQNRRIVAYDYGESFDNREPMITDSLITQTGTPRVYGGTPDLVQNQPIYYYQQSPDTLPYQQRNDPVQAVGYANQPPPFQDPMYPNPNV